MSSVNDVSVHVTQYLPAIDRMISFTLYENPHEVTQTPTTKIINGVNVIFDTPLITDPVKDNTSITFSCPTTGPKPSISLTFKELPGQLCYSVELKIKYNNLKNIDIKKYNRMTIEAGYPGETMTIDSPIFYSYIDAPSPLGTCVFGGLAVGNVNQMYSISNISFLCYKNTQITLGTLVASVCMAMGCKVDTPCGMMKDDGSITEGLDPLFYSFWNQPWPKLDSENNPQDQEMIGSTVVEMMNKLSTILVEYGKNLTDIDGLPLHIYTIITGTKFCIGYWGEEQTATKTAEQNEIVCLVNVKSASFTGPVLSVVAPWVPSLKPFSLFWMPINFYSTQTLMNAQAKTDIQSGQWDLYRAINIDVQFSTTDPTNQMTIQALPLKEIEEQNIEVKEVEYPNITDIPTDIQENEQITEETQSTSTTNETNNETASGYIKVIIGEASEIPEIQITTPSGSTSYPYNSNQTALNCLSGYEILKSGMTENTVGGFCHNQYSSFTITNPNGSQEKIGGMFLWPLVIQLTYELGLQTNPEVTLPCDFFNPFAFYPKGSTIAYPTFSSDNIMDDLVSMDSSGDIRQIYYNWIVTSYNFNYVVNWCTYKLDVDIMISVYNSLAYLAGDYSYLKCTEEGIEEIG